MTGSLATQTLRAGFLRKGLAALAGAWLLLAMPALAAVSDPAELLRDPAQEERAREIGRELRCMVCQNQSIEDSDAELARDLRRIVREQVTAGRSNTDILGYLHDRYGDFVLLRPPVKPGTYLLWGTPVLALGLGLAMIVTMRRRRTTPAAPQDLSAAERARLRSLEDGSGT